MTWSDSEVFLEPDPEWVNIMSVSLLRLQNGHLGCAFLVKPDKDSCLPYWTVSQDDGETWREPQLIGDDAQYCYYSLLFFGDRSLVTTYESATIQRDDGSQEKKGRAKLRMMVLDNSWWLQ